MGRSRKIARTLITGAALFLSHSKTAYASVNVKDSSFSTTMTDLDTGRFKIIRTYDSRSTFDGLFGFGWCSNLDRRLVKAPGARFESTGQRPKEASAKDTMIAIDLCGERHFFDASGAKPTRRWEGVRRADGAIEYKDGAFVHLGPEGREVARFEATDGRLSALGPARLSREPRRSLLRDAATGEGLRVRLEVDPLANKVSRIEADEGGPETRRQASYEYDGQGDLSKVTNAWNNSYSFRYDSFHNLIEIRYPDRTSEEMTYDTDRDRLLTFRGRNSCVERYETKLQGTKNTRRQWTIAVKSCDGRETSRITFDFTYQRVVDDRWKLVSIKTDKGGAR